MPQAASTRWCPTAQQLMILQDMYRAGVRNPNAFQIRQITSHLSFYGKIEGKNVFYWFQNHKARERQKLKKRMLKQLQHQYHLERLGAKILHVQPHYHDFFHHHDQDESKAVNHMYKMVTADCEETSKPVEGVGENHEWVILQIIPENVCRAPLRTLDLFPITSNNLKEEKDRDSPSSLTATTGSSSTVDAD